MILGLVDDNAAWQADLIDTVHREKWTPEGERDMEVFSAKLSNVTVVQRDLLYQRRIIDSLEYLEIADRYEAISPAHQKTLEWIFNPPSSLTTTNGDPKPDAAAKDANHLSETEHDNIGQKSKEWDSLTEWLEGPGTFYWITGKVGSGKSTLMKFLYNDPRTVTYAQNWSKDRTLLLAGFFFWISGTSMQTSHMGLLRSLLYDLIQGQPSLIPTIFPRRWDKYDLFGGDHGEWTWLELTKALEILVSNESLCFLFLIDGLDEFDGNTSELNEFILKLSQSSNVKICAASRPWPAFEEAFIEKPRLRLEDLTRRDIYDFASERLQSNSVFRNMQTLMPQDSQHFISEITDKACGVFLWVRLAVQSLLDGLRDGDTLHGLKARLLALPAELEELFMKILNRLDPEYFREASELFQIMHAAKTRLNLLELSLAHDGIEQAIAAPFTQFTTREKKFRADNMRRRINSRCKGLLEVPDLRKHGYRARVQYLHRTVKDFLEKGAIWKHILTGTTEDYNPYEMICGAFLRVLKQDTEWLDLYTVNNFWKNFDIVLCYMETAETTHPVSPEVLDALYDTGEKFWLRKIATSEREITWLESIFTSKKIVDKGWDWTDTGRLEDLKEISSIRCRFLNYRANRPLACAFRLNLLSYIRAAITKGIHKGESINGEPLLRAATLGANVSIVKLLLQHELSEKHFEKTLHLEWYHLLEHLQVDWYPLSSEDEPTEKKQRSKSISPERAAATNEVLHAFLDYGAGTQPSKKSPQFMRTTYAEAAEIISEALRFRVPDEDIESLLSKLRENERGSANAILSRGQRKSSKKAARFPLALKILGHLRQ